jgi:hypothetical protein
MTATARVKTGKEERAGTDAMRHIPLKTPGRMRFNKCKKESMMILHGPEESERVKEKDRNAALVHDHSCLRHCLYAPESVHACRVRHRKQISVSINQNRFGCG